MIDLPDLKKQTTNLLDPVDGGLHICTWIYARESESFEGKRVTKGCVLVATVTTPRSRHANFVATRSLNANTAAFIMLDSSVRRSCGRLHKEFGSPQRYPRLFNRLKHVHSFTRDVYVSEVL